MAREFLSGLPGTNLHGMNLDYILSEIQRINISMDEIITEKISKLALNAFYDATSETLTITLEEA